MGIVPSFLGGPQFPCYVLHRSTLRIVWLMGNHFEKHHRVKANSFAQISFFASAFLSPSHDLICSWLQTHSREISGLPRATSLILCPVTPPGSSAATESEGGGKKRLSLGARLPLQISTSPPAEMGHLARKPQTGVTLLRKQPVLGVNCKEFPPLT